MPHDSVSGDPAAYDLVIRGGDVVDGSGLAPYRADVGIRAGTIARIGIIHDRGRDEIDASGHVIAPGFIDGHTHMDAQVFWDGSGSCSCCQGVTTVVMGHCGFTLAPASKEQSHLVVRNLERAEDISPAALAAGITWSWTTFREYLDAVDARPKGVNFAANVGHCALRTYAMGERAFDGEATPEDLEVMAAELRDALRAGAYGLSTSRTFNHKTSDARPVASRLASWDEVRFLVEVLGDEGAGIFQITEDSPTPEALQANHQRLVDLSIRTGVPIAVNATRGGLQLELLDRAIAAGARMFGLTHSRGIGVMSSFRTQLAFDKLPEWQRVRALPEEEFKAALRDPATRAQLVHAANHVTYGDAVGTEARRPEYDQMFVMDSPVPPYRTVAEIAKERAADPVEVMIDLALGSDLNQFFVQPLRRFDHEAVRAAMKHPATVMAFSDSGAHVSQISDCSIQTHLLAHWVRDRGDFTLQEAVRMLTFAPARAWGFHDRGLIREGLAADINVFDPDTVGPDMPYLAHDLPAGEPRIKQEAIGFLATIVNGQITHLRGRHTGASPGVLIRGPLASTHNPKG
jgi:N-acyl-D-aspartate/D-glutamate deacylase